MVSNKRNNARLTGYGARDRKKNKNGGKEVINNYYNVARFNRRMYPLPETFRTTLVYYEQVNFSAVTTPQLYVFRGNSPYDPDQTGTGGQPVGWDNLATFYSSVGVVASRITFKVVNGISNVLQLAVSPVSTSTQFSSYEQMRYYGTDVKYLDLDGTTRGGSSFGTLQSTAVSTRVLGRPWSADFISLVTSVTGLQWYWVLGIQSADTVTAITANVQITIEYDVIYSLPKLVALS